MGYFTGKTVLLFGDSHSDGASTPGGRLGAHITADGARQVFVDAKSGRSGRSYFLNEGGDALLAHDVSLHPDVVVMIFGTNSIGHDLHVEAEAIAKIAGAFRAGGAEVWCVGPPYWPPAIVTGADAVTLNAGAEKVVAFETLIFGDHFLDGRPMTKDIPAQGRAYTKVGDSSAPGIHFTGSGAQTWADRMYGAIMASAAIPASFKPSPQSGSLALPVIATVLLAGGVAVVGAAIVRGLRRRR